MLLSVDCFHFAKTEKSASFEFERLIDTQRCELCLWFVFVAEAGLGVRKGYRQLHTLLPGVLHIPLILAGARGGSLCS